MQLDAVLEVEVSAFYMYIQGVLCTEMENYFSCFPAKLSKILLYELRNTRNEPYGRNEETVTLLTL